MTIGEVEERILGIEDYPGIRALSICALLAIALRGLERYAEKYALMGEPHFLAFLDHFWDFLLIGSPEDFQLWEANPPVLFEAAFGDPYPSGYSELLERAGIDPVEFDRLLMFTAEIIWTNLYGASNHKSTLENAGGVFQILRSHGIEPPDPSLFEESLWVDRNGYGVRLSPEDVSRWRFA